ncbi:DNA-directed RNA polymerase specialized sigma24 family protein [Micromonospora sp. A200]|uniref:hypothetical protein n=1 Tax=Micromonospora sp. A200 TaxID=2940568 RepID=UPI002476F962|nr:hypothetical protein [Micromonospora sp. A200]MDH6462026.1 DNA-directed RNA polymerase specialized sigma24 family protein [Micromonospora sp. A200]
MSSYDRELVERLLPAVWDSSFAYGMEDPRAPDPDMPRTKPNPKTGNTLYAHLADIKGAWRSTYLPLEERQALFLRYGMDWLERDIAAQLATPRQTISDRLIRGVGRIVAHLNGDECEIESEDTTQ